jgi:cytoskeletal protein RodZ
MSLTLGEKLRQAREERGFSLSEVSEQTRISSLYLESIENDDYGILPGGIFNKGFVKSYAKFVGLNEQEALLDYSGLIAQSDAPSQEELRLYKPEVLTDDSSSRSMIPTWIKAVVLLGIMTGAVLIGLNFLRRQGETPAANSAAVSNNGSLINGQGITEDDGAKSASPDMSTLKVEFKAMGQPVSLTATTDGKMSSNVVTPGSTSMFEPKESLKLSYSRSLASFVQLTINGKAISLPAEPLVPRRNAIEFEINRSNIGQIWTRGAISTDVPAANPDTNANSNSISTATLQTPPAGRPTAVVKPSAAVNAAVTPAANKPPALPKASPKPPTMMTKPPANKPA